MVADADLPPANALLSAGREVGAIIGPPMAGLLYPVLGARGVLAIDAATFVAVIPLLARLAQLKPPERSDEAAEARLHRASSPTPRKGYGTC